MTSGLKRSGLWRRVARLAAVLALSACPSFAAHAAGFDHDAAWPLCGRITQNPPVGWQASDGCPASRFGRAEYSDEPLSSTFGPRPLYSENDRYDFHRGIDIAAPTGTPFFAVVAGEVRIAGTHDSYSDPLVQLRHARRGREGCEPAGCYFSLYLHIDSWVVTEGQLVEKGQLLGFTGASGSGFEHLHFEVRSAPSIDPYSAWQRDAVHPLRLLPYTAAPEARLTVAPWDTMDPVADLALVTPRYDLLAVDIEVLDAKLRPVPQPGDVADARGYHVHPPFFDMDRANFSYSHKNSAAFPWSSFGAGGENECPYHAQHGSAYSPHVHLDAPDPADLRRGLFNGIGVRTLRYWPSDEGAYEVGLRFSRLRGPAACLEATATFVNGPPVDASQGSCASAEAKRLRLRVAGNGTKVRLSWSGGRGGKSVIYRNGREIASGVAGKHWVDRDAAAGSRYRYRVCPERRMAECSYSRVLSLPR